MGLVNAIIALASEVFKFVNAKEATKKIDRMLEIREIIRKEEEKGYYADDAKIESLHRELKNYVEAAKDEMVLAMSKKS